MPHVPAGNVSNWAQYTIEHPDRDGLAAHLKEQGVPTAVYYPIPLHLQPAYDALPARAAGPAGDRRLKERVISLPMHSDLDEATQDRIIAAVASLQGLIRMNQTSAPPSRSASPASASWAATMPASCPTSATST